MFGKGAADLRERLTVVEHMIATIERDNTELRSVILEINKSMGSIREFMNKLSGQELNERTKQQDRRIRSIEKDLHEVDIKTTEASSVLTTYLQSLSRGSSHREASAVAVQISQKTVTDKRKDHSTSFGDIDTDGGNFSGTGDNNENY